MENEKMKITEELWKDISGYEGLYQISSFGRVKSTSGKFANEIIRANTVHANGYLQVQLHKNKVKKQFKIHRLVASAFIPNPSNKPTVNHIDGNKTNNKVDNLEWNTSQENTIHAHRNKLVNRFKGRSIEAINGFGKKKSFSNIHEAIADGYSKSGISRACISGRGYKGYNWKYTTL